MSNNRIWLRCNRCGRAILLGKCGLGEYVTYYENLSYGLDTFFERHSFECDTDRFEAEFDGHMLEPKFIPKDSCHQNNFEIAYDFYREE